MEVSATEAEAMTAEGVGWDSKMRTATAGETQESDVEEVSGDMVASGSNTGKATSTAADEAGVGGRHWKKPGIRGMIAGRRENPSGKSLGVGVTRGAARPSEWPTSPWEWGTRREP